MDTKETLMVIQMVISPIVSISIPFIAARLAKAKPKEDTEKSTVIFESRWSKPLLLPFILMAAYNLIGFSWTMVSKSPLSALTVGVLCLYSGGFFMSIFLCFFSIFYYSLRRGIELECTVILRRTDHVYELLSTFVPIVGSLVQKNKEAEQIVGEQPAISDPVS